LFPRRKASFGESLFLFLGENYITVSREKKRERETNK
jgi:hypothetical protein